MALLLLSLAVAVTRLTNFSIWQGVRFGEAAVPGPNGIPSKHLQCHKCLNFFSSPGSLKEHLVRRICAVASNDPYEEMVPMMVSAAADAMAESVRSSSSNGDDLSDDDVLGDLADDAGGATQVAECKTV